MTVGEMIDYLKDFDRDLPLLMAALDPPARIIYPVTKVVVFTDTPGFGLEVTKGEKRRAVRRGINGGCRDGRNEGGARCRD